MLPAGYKIRGRQMNRYASNTQVSSDKSRSEIERTLSRYGADQFLYGWQDEMAMIGFRMNGKMVKFYLPLPDRNSDQFRLTETGRERNRSSSEKAFEQAVRQKWRALALVVKAKLEAVESEITTFESEFMAHIVLPNGSTVGETMLPQIEETYKTGKMPAMLPMPKGMRK